MDPRYVGLMTDWRLEGLRGPARGGGGGVRENEPTRMLKGSQ
jgi:hypothetical protein